MDKREEAKRLVDHFSRYFHPVIAVDKELKREVFKIRHNVYCDELKYEPIRASGMETDEFDMQSKHTVIFHKQSKASIGCVRMVACKENQLIPIEKHCNESIERMDLHPSRFPRAEICEVSRLAVKAEFRKRSVDKYEGSAEGGINNKTYSETELRGFPFVSMGLYMAVLALCSAHNLNHLFLMIEPRFARSLRIAGLKFEPLGPAIDYHGIRAPHYANLEDLLVALRPALKILFYEINKTLIFRKRTQAQVEEHQFI